MGQKRWCFLYCQPEQTVEQPVELSAIWDALTRMWSHCSSFLTAIPHSRTPLWHGHILWIVNWNLVSTFFVTLFSIVYAVLWGDWIVLASRPASFLCVSTGWHWLFLLIHHIGWYLRYWIMYEHPLKDWRFSRTHSRITTHAAHMTSLSIFVNRNNSFVRCTKHGWPLYDHIHCSRPTECHRNDGYLTLSC